MVVSDFKWTDAVLLKGKADESAVAGHDDLAGFRDKWHASTPNLKFTLKDVTPLVTDRFYFKVQWSGTKGDETVSGEFMAEVSVVGGQQAVGFTIFHACADIL